MTLRRFLPIAFLIAHGAIVPVAFAQPEPRGYHQVHVELNYAASSANEAFDPHGKSAPLIDEAPASVVDFPWADRALVLGVEYGLTPRLALLGNVAVRRVIVTSPRDRRVTEGFGDLGLGLRLELFPVRDIAFGTMDLGLSVPTGYDRTRVPALGTGTVDASISVTAGAAYDSLEESSFLRSIPGLYYSTTIGSRIRSRLYRSSASDQSTDSANFATLLTAGIEFGFRPLDWLAVRIMGRQTFATRDDETPFDLNRYPEAGTYSKAGIGSTIHLNSMFALFGEAFISPGGQQALKSTDITLGISFTSAATPPPEVEPIPVDDQTVEPDTEAPPGESSETAPDSEAPPPDDDLFAPTPGSEEPAPADQPPGASSNAGDASAPETADPVVEEPLPGSELTEPGAETPKPDGESPNPTPKAEGPK